MDAPAESQTVCYTCIGGRSDGEKWVDYYGELWHDDPDCSELGDTRWAVDETVRPPCSECVTDCAHGNCEMEWVHDIDVSEGGTTKQLVVCDHHLLELLTRSDAEVDER